MASKKIQRQLKRAFGIEDPDAYVAQLQELLGAPGLPAELREKLRPLLGFPALVDALERSNVEYEERYQMSSRNLDISSLELSQKNDKLRELNQTVNSMVDSLGEGYLLVNDEGVCGTVYSRVSETIFKRSPVGVPLFDLLGLPESERETFADWLRLVFAARLSATDIGDLGPTAYVNGDGRTFGLRYSTIGDAKGVKWLVVIAADRTEELEATKLAVARQDEAKLITKLVEDKEQFQSFVQTAFEVLATVKGDHLSPEDLKQFRLDLHTLKGGAATFHMRELEQSIHEHELRLQDVRPLENGEASGIARHLEVLLTGSLKRYQRILGPNELWLDHVTVSRRRISELVETGVKEDVNLTFLESLLRETLWAEVGSLFTGFEATLQVTAGRSGKHVHPLKITGASDLRVPRETYRKFIGSLVHLFRNAVDHGLELPNDRVVAGKDRVGQIEVRFGAHAGRRDWWLEIEDDGAGVNIEAIRERLRVVGVADSDKWTEDQVLSALLQYSLSTRTQVTETSGMGVGLIAVGAALKEIGGSYTVTNKPGKGTCFRFELPWIEQLKKPLEAAKPKMKYMADSADLNFRYNEMISEMASLVRESAVQQRLQNELEMARAVQKALMPAPAMDYEDFSVSGRCYAAESCGGDWWYHVRSGDKLLVWIGDVLGHDIAAALVASACRATVTALRIQNPDASVSQQMEIMNDVIHSMTKGDVYLTAICMEVNLRTGEVEVGSASHPPFFVLQNPNEPRPAPLRVPNNPPLGLSAAQKFQSSRMTMQPGQGLFLMTDGLLEVPTTANVPIREPRLIKLLNGFLQRKPTANGVVSSLEEYIYANGSGELADDVTYVAVHRKKAA